MIILLSLFDDALWLYADTVTLYTNSLTLSLHADTSSLYTDISTLYDDSLLTYAVFLKIGTYKDQDTLKLRTHGRNPQRRKFWNKDSGLSP